MKAPIDIKRGPGGGKPSWLYLHPAQMAVFNDPARFKCVVAGRRWGKALALDTPVPTPSGWTTMGDLKDGDLVFDDTGKPCRVVKAHEIMHNRPCYEIELSDGTSVVADEEHLWSTWTHRARKNSRRNPKGDYGPAVVTTRQMLDTLKIGNRGDNNHSIPCALPVEYANKTLSIDPYIIGAWLGDGDSRCAAITVGSQDLDFMLDQVRVILGIEPTLTEGRPGVWRLALTEGHGCSSRVQSKMRSLNLLGDKHIPNIYLQSSVSQRLALLQGLMDTDGSCDKQAGNCEFTSTNQRLADHAMELITSLGIKARMITGRAILNGRDCGLKFRIKFSTDLSVFRLPRKLALLPAARRFRINHRFIVGIRSVDSVPVRCITVDSPNSLYLCTRSFLPTHNTQLSKVWLIRKAAAKKKSLVWYIAPTYQMARQIMWQELLDAIPRRMMSRNPHETMMTIWLRNGSVIQLKGADKPDTLRGVGLDAVVMDEIQDMRASTWSTVIQPTLASTNGQALFIGTPKSFNHLYDLFMDGQSAEHADWASWQFKTITSPFIPASEIERAKRTMNEKEFRQEFEASFETMSNRVYHAFDRSTHVGRVKMDPKYDIMVGMDFNVDPMSAVFFQLRDGNVRVFGERILTNSSTMEMGEELDRLFWRQKHKVIIYPDPAGTQRSSAGGKGGVSDFAILKQMKFTRLKYRRQHPRVRDRVNAVNRMLMSGDGTSRVLIDHSCKKLIESFEQTQYKTGTSEIDKRPGIEHATDAFGYPIEVEFPVRDIQIMGVSF